MPAAKVSPSPPPQPIALDPQAAIDAIPETYNFAADLLERNLAAGRAEKVAYIDPRGTCTYGRLVERVERFGQVLLSMGVQKEQRVLLALFDTLDWPTVFLGAIKVGVVPVPVNTMSTEEDCRFMLTHSGAKALIVSEALLPKFTDALAASSDLKHVIVSGENGHGHDRLDDLLESAQPLSYTAPTNRDDICFWLYTSGSTGKPKAAVHVHASLRLTADLYASGVLNLKESDVCYSVGKLFFAYGLGNSLTFPLAAGATTVLSPDRPTPQGVGRILREHPVTVFYGVPTFYAAFLADADAPAREMLKLRQCVSAGEALPPAIGRRWKERYGVDILDGIGSTEMLHIFMSNYSDDVRYGTTGRPVPGYEVRLVDENGDVLTTKGAVGELQVRGPTSAVMYWKDRAKSRSTFLGEWTRSGDKFIESEDGYFIYCGRSDDMLKVGGMYVSPIEVESALSTHPDVLEAAVIAWPDEHNLIKPKALVVLKAPERASDQLAEELKQHVKSALAPYKYPRWIEFRSTLPKTANGKIQRFKLRHEAAARSVEA